MEKSPENAHHLIEIQGINPDGTLILSDDGTTIVHPGNTVTWKIGQGSGVAAIYIMDDNGSPNVFHHDLRKLPFSTDWRGRVKPYEEAVVEHYSIFFYLDRGDEIGRYDPKIQVNP
jgi:hypothetical protein